MTEASQFSLIRKRVARELDIYTSRSGLSYKELAAKIRNHSRVAVGLYNRAGVDNAPLTPRALEGLILGTRSSQSRAVNACKDFLTLERSFPTKNGRSLVFDIDPIVLDLAKRQSQFFGVENFLRRDRKEFCGVYQIVHPLRFQSFILIVDYLQSENVLLCRGIVSLNSLNNRNPPLFLSGYVIPSKSSIHFFMTDHFRPEAYVIEIPIELNEDPNDFRFEMSMMASFIIPDNKRNQQIFEKNSKNYVLLDPESVDAFFYPNYPSRKNFEEMINKGGMNNFFCDVFSEYDYTTLPKNILTKRLQYFAGNEYYNFKHITDIYDINVKKDAYDLFRKMYNY